MRVYAIATLLVLIMAAGGFVYLAITAETMAPAPHEARVNVDIQLPR